jgi:hypothetical protein
MAGEARQTTNGTNINKGENDMPKLTSAAALGFVTRIELLHDQISAVYREVAEYDEIGNINLIRDIVKAREEAKDQAYVAEGMIASLDSEDDD